MAMAKHIANGVVLCPVEYFSHAMQYFREQYGRAQFIVASDDLEWCKKYVTGKYIVYSSHTYILDFAILAMSDHVITSIGTFGWWAGWLCTGTTIYYGVPPPNGTLMATMMNSNWRIPPDDEFNNWIPVV
jgi:galactoside 2-L-fucosyltransferase 1/2